MRMMGTIAQQLLASGIDLSRKQLTIVDVGSGSMRYGYAIAQWALALAEEVRILAVDPLYKLPPSTYPFFPDFSGNSLVTLIEKVPAGIETALPILRTNGVNSIDIITLFNPHPDQTPFPNVTRLEELCRGVPLVDTCDSVIQKPTLVEELSKQGYNVAMFTNPAKKGMLASYTYEFDPLFVALPKSLA